jgi:hypothetical protein
MDYYKVISHIQDNEIEELQKGLESSDKNKDIDVMRDYYLGNQWRFESQSDYRRINTTRSGKEMWVTKDPKDPKGAGFRRGEIKTWNLCDSVVDIYSSYVRGTIKDSNKIEVMDNPVITSKMNELVNVDSLVQRTTHRMAIDSVAVWKYRNDNGLEFVDPKEIFPIYDGNLQKGTIRMYEVSEHDPMLKGISIKKSKRYWYMEIWVNQDEVWKLYKYVNGKRMDNKDMAPYRFDPHILVINKDAEFVKFDEDHIELSDVSKIIDIQDDLNATITDISAINRKVAIPMMKVADEVYNAMLKGEISADKVRESLQKLTVMAGRIISAPIETMDAKGLPDSTIKFVESIYDQLYKTTGIPKVIFQSDGMANISTESIGYLMESLKRRVDEKRANIERGVQDYVETYAVQANSWSPDLRDATSIHWSNMFETSDTQKADTLIRGRQAQVLPDEYALEKLLGMLGDEERLQEVLGMKMENDATKKLDIEKSRIRQEIEKTKEQEIRKAQEERDKAKEEAMKRQKDNELLEKEMQNLANSI